ncbi:hypothetical protein [Curtobacterium ammoniigenes]|uniref:hypothetical protein n=1 Tax=Curtobacterium ammoniigenes TaxID=395387 RepID=UPI000836E2EE|nr:hypothetical protein [Curtobacterium ammoniigenes]
MNIASLTATISAALAAVGTIAASATGATAATLDSATTSPSASPSTSASAPAHLGKTASLADIQAAGAAATAKRITSLNTAIGKVNGDKTLTAGDRTTILTTLNADVAGMQKLAATIAADTTAQQARTDYKSIFSEYRVYVVGLAQTRIVRIDDRVLGATLQHLQTAEQKLSARLTAHPTKDTDGAKSALSDMQTQIATVQSDAQGLGAAALAVSPSQWTSNHSALSGTEAKAKSMVAAAKAAAKDASTIRAALKG